LDRRIRTALSKFQAVVKYKSSKLSFLDDYQYHLKTADLLPYGASEWVIRFLVTRAVLTKHCYRSYLSGSTLFERYSHLATTTPFVRASGSERVIQTAGNWTSGEPTPLFARSAVVQHLVLGYESASKSKLPLFQVIPEIEGVSTRQYETVTALYWHITESQQYPMG
jgi:hypothetical protein